MKKVLFISNKTNKITNFIIPAIYATKECGYAFHCASNFVGLTKEQIDAYEKQYDIKIHHIPFYRNPFNIKNIKTYRQLKQLIKEQQYELIHCNTPIGGLLGRLAARKFKIKKVIYTAHGFHFYKGAPLKNWLLYCSAERFLAKYTHTLITMNQEDYAISQKFKCKNAIIIPGVGIDTTHFMDASVTDNYKEEFHLPDDAVVVIAVGELIKRKNYKTLIQAISMVKTSNVHLLICGMGILEKKLQAIIQKTGCSSKIKLLGFRRDIPSLLKFSDIFVMTSYQEGLPRAVMEAMAAGKPVICSKIRGNTDLIDENRGGFLVDPNDAKGFAEKIEILASDEIKRQQFERYNMEKVKGYDISVVKEKMMRIYHNILQNKGERK